jgi:ABC-type taurine transport system ATPase subunit
MTRFTQVVRRTAGDVVGGQQLRQGLAAALPAAELLLLSDDQKFAHLSALLATILIDGHILSSM